MIRALVFDLDNCLAAADEAGDALFAPAFDAMRAHGELSPAAMADCWVHALDVVARKHGWSDEMLAAGWEAFRTLEVKAPLRGYPDLAEIERLSVARFLVTTGFRRLQESKVAALGTHEESALRRHRAATWLGTARGADRRGQRRLGDRCRNELGMPTVQTLRPRVQPAANARWRIKSFAELSKLIPKIHSTPGQ